MNDIVRVLVSSPLWRRLIEDMTMRRFTRETQHHYIRDVERFATWLGRSPHAATAKDVRRFQIEQQDAGVPVPTMNMVVSALRFLFTQTLDRPELARKLVRTTHERKIPTVLSMDEVKRLLNATTCLKHQAALSVAYGAACASPRYRRLRSATSTASACCSASNAARGAATATPCCPKGCSSFCGTGGEPAANRA